MALKKILGKIARSFLLVLAGVFSTLVLLLYINSMAYHPPVFPDYSTTNTRRSFLSLKDSIEFTSSLKKRFGIKKNLPQKYQAQILIALSFFPELKEIPIKFIEKEALFPLSSHPQLLDLIIPFKEREYIITISTKSKEEYEEILLKNLSFDGQIGVIGHEFAHTSFYLDKSPLEIVYLGVLYFFDSSFRRVFERETDLNTVRKGLGYQLLNWRIYYEKLIDQEGSKKIKNGIYFEDRYLSSEEIKKAMRRFNDSR